MSIRRQMATGAAWMVSMRLCVRLIGMLSTIILARLLMPEDFGLVAMSTVIMGLVLRLSETNVEAVLIQRPAIDPSYLNGAFGLRLLVSAAQAAVLAASAIPVATFYGEPRIEAIIYILAGVAWVNGLTNIGTIYFQRELQFHREFLMRALPKMAAFCVTVAIAVTTRSYWALVAGIATNQAGRVILSYAMSPVRPWPTRQHWNEIFRFSKWLIVNQGLEFIGTRGPTIVLGKVVGGRSVGLFSVAYEVAMLPTTEIAAPINRVAFPGYSRMGLADGQLRRGYLDVAGLIALVAVPAGVGVAATASLLVPLLLGPHWSDAVPLVEMLAVAGAILALLTNADSVYLALGRPHITTMISALHTILQLAGASYGVVVAGPWGVALSYLAVTALMVPVQLLVTLRILSARLIDYLRVVYRPVLATAAMYLLLNGYVVPELAALDMPLAARTLGAVAVGAGAYGALELLLWLLAGRPAGPERHALQLAGAFMNRLRPRRA